jgi:diguanylate cyclase (GGDEF)-like protein
LRARLEKLRRENEALRRESRIDELTRVLNRRGFDEMAASLFENGAHGVVVLAADIDDFKLFNDRFGHGVGDALLESLAGELRGLFGDEYLSRFGGDEFQAILVDPDDAMMARMRDFFFRLHTVELRGRTYTYRCCAGYARRSEDQEGFSELCRRADMALYHAKLARGGAFEFEAAMRGDRRSQLGFSLRDISNGLPAAVFAYRDDPTEEILFANRHCVELFGCSSYDELLDLCDGSFRGMMDPSQRDRVEASIRSQIEDGAGSDRDFAAYDIVRADGQRVRVLDAGRLVDNEYYGRVFFVLLINAELVEGWVE